MKRSRVEMRYYPLTTNRFEHQFAVRALGAEETIVETTDRYHQEIQLRRELLDTHRELHCLALTGSEAAQQEVFELVCSAACHLADGRNEMTDEWLASDPESPLFSIGRHVQEDLAILSSDASQGYPLIAGNICFPSGWCIADKLGKSMLAIHQPVPEFDRALYGPTERLMDRLKPGRPVWRTNWGIRPTHQLDQSPGHAAFLDQQRALVNSQNADQRCFFRVERQTLARLPKSRCILFAIHTHQCPLGDLASWQRANLLGVLTTCPEATLRYKGILPMRDALIESLRRRSGD